MILKQTMIKYNSDIKTLKEKLISLLDDNFNGKNKDSYILTLVDFNGMSVNALVSPLDIFMTEFDNSKVDKKYMEEFVEKALKQNYSDSRYEDFKIEMMSGKEFFVVAIAAIEKTTRKEKNQNPSSEKIKKEENPS